MLENGEFDVGLSDGSTRHYVTNQFPFKKWSKLKTRLLKIGFEPMMMLANLAQGPEGLSKNVTLSDFIPIIQSLLSKLDPDDEIDLITELLSGVRGEVNGSVKDVNINTDFQGEQLHLYMLVGRVVQFQFGSFFSGLVGLMPKDTARKEGVRRVKAV